MNKRDMKVSCVEINILLFLKNLFFSLNLFGLQDYPTYTILGQSQYQACYPSSSFGVTGQTNSDAESTTLAATTYQTEKPSVMVPAPAAQRLSSGKHHSSKNFALSALHPVGMGTIILFWSKLQFTGYWLSPSGAFKHWNQPVLSHGQVECNTSSCEQKCTKNEKTFYGSYSALPMTLT